MTNTDLNATLLAMGERARAASRALAQATAETKNAALEHMAAHLRRNSEHILRANAQDVEAATQGGLAPSMLDRLALDGARVRAMAQGIEAIARLNDPVGQTIADWTRPNGLRIRRVRVPLGVIGIIYESRPNVTADAGALCLKSGNAAILRGGSESLKSSSAIVACLRQGLADAGLPVDAVQMVPTTDRAAVGLLLSGLNQAVDVIVPRGGRSLIARVQADARVPVIGHLEGLCHVYIDANADPDMARAIVLDAKLRRTGICGAAETLLLDSAASEALQRDVIGALLDAGCEVRAHAALRALDSRLQPVTEADWSTEYLDAIISAAPVDGVAGAVAHIARYGSGHTEAIVTGDEAQAAAFLAGVDSAIVLHNASTQFADGGEFGMGAEIGISTGKLHARGPVGVEQLTSYKYVVAGTGQVRG
ncbi:MAG: glutamate-5-semialdehyde dehydrogenase [Gammaproteobacteria bacterium]